MACFWVHVRGRMSMRGHERWSSATETCSTQGDERADGGEPVRRLRASAARASFRAGAPLVVEQLLASTD